MILDFFFSILILAGVGRLWGKTQKDFPALKNFIKTKTPHLVSKAFTCSFCFTFWISLVFVLIFDPLRGWSPLIRVDFLNNFKFIISILCSWMTIGTGSWIMRFIMDELQHLVHYQNHILKEKSGHK